MAGTSEGRNPVFGWAMYDAAASPFATTVVGAVLPVYFQTVVVPAQGVAFLGGRWTAESLWGLATGIGPLILLILMPVLGAIADRWGSKGSFLRTFTYGGAAATVALLAAGEGDVWFTLGIFTLALVLFAGAGVFYDGFLTDVSTPDTVHRISARGVAYGFVAGGLHLVMALGLISVWSHEMATPVAIASAGVWWLALARITFRHLQGVPTPTVPPGASASVGSRVREGVKRTLATARQVRRFPHLSRFVTAYLLYGTGVQTTVLLTAVYAAETLQLDQTTVIVAFLLVQVLSIASSLGAAGVAGRLGVRPTMTLTLVIWLGAIVAAYFLPVGQPLPFYGLAVVIGLVLAALGTLSRSLFASMIPRSAAAEFFGYYSVISRFASIWGPLAFAGVRQATGSGRLAILSVVGFLLAGLLVFRRVDIAQAQTSRLKWV